MLHAMIVIPYYFVGTLAALPFLILLSRLTRVKAPINALVGGAIGFSLAAIIVPLAAGWLSLAMFTGRPLLILIVASFTFAAIDLALSRSLPLPLDSELSEL